MGIQSSLIVFLICDSQMTNVVFIDSMAVWISSWDVPGQDFRPVFVNWMFFFLLICKSSHILNLSLRCRISIACCCCYYCYVASVVSDSVRPHRRQPTRLLRPCDSPGKNTGVGCHFLLQYAYFPSSICILDINPYLYWNIFSYFVVVFLLT